MKKISCFIAFKFVCLAFALLLSNTSSVLAADFPANAGTLGAIPDYPVNAGGCHVSGWVDKDVTFTVSGVSGAPTNVEIKNLTFSPAHTWGGDVTATLIAPNGTSSVVFGRVGATTATAAGTSSDLAGPYGFRNTTDPNIWSVAANPFPSNTYTAVQSGGAGAVNPQPAINLDTAFAGVAAPNGTWTLRLRDGCDGDTGGVSAVTLTVDGAAVPVNAPHDTTGDGKSDFTIVRAAAGLAQNSMLRYGSVREKLQKQEELISTNAPQASINWMTSTNGSGAFTGLSWGLDTDFFVMEDFNGDGRDDIAVWRPAPANQAAFYILHSDTFTVQTELFGQTGDDPTIVGDWDNDGKADVTVYRDGAVGSPQSFFYYRGTFNNPSGNITVIPWGVDGDVAYSLDYDGDGKLDPAVQRNGGGGLGVHYVARSSSNFTTYEQIYYGFSSDFVVPGDYDGDGRDDIAISRNANFGTGTFKYFWIRESDGGGSPNNALHWGIPGDFICQGDYDGDGKTDLGIWRSNADPTQNFFHVRHSSTGALQSQEWGQNGDYPVNNWNVH